VRDAVERAFQVRTPRGGLHVYFKGEGPSTASRIADGIDTRGGILRDGKIVSGGYVLLPGSKTMTGITARFPAAGSSSFPNRFRRSSPSARKPTPWGSKRTRTRTNRATSNGRSTCSKIMSRPAVSLCRGTAATNRVSGGRFDPRQSDFAGRCVRPLWEHWNPHCSPPWDDWELETIVRNAASYGEDTEGGVKGFQANVDAFSNFQGQEFEPPMPPERRDRIQPLHDYADHVQDPTWLIPGLLPAHGIGMLYGESGSFKSFLALDMALSLAFGIPGQWGAPPVKNDVLFLAGEGPVATAKKRWPAWMEWQNIEFRNDHRFFISPKCRSIPTAQHGKT
jgi:hypothetical protein